jgi:alkylhydroperoxidase family enzyme
MAFINTISASHATGAVHDMYQRQQDHWGYVPNYATVFSHRPEVMGRWGRLLAEVRRPVDDCRFELVTFAVAMLLKHTACSLAHGAKLAEILGTETVVAIADGREAEVLSDENVAIVRFARDIARDASSITSRQVDVLRSVFGLTEAEIFDIAAIASARCFFTKVLDALGTELDPGLTQLNSELSQHLLGSPAPASLLRTSSMSRRNL